MHYRIGLTASGPGLRGKFQDGMTLHGIYDLLKELVLPPADLLVVLGIGVVLLLVGRSRTRRVGLALTLVGTVLFYLLSTPAVGVALLDTIQTPPADETALASSGAQAIVVLAGGFTRYAPEYGGASVDEITLQRLRYAAHLARRLELPVLVSGGMPPNAASSLADLMKLALEQDFGVPVRWVEGRSADTFENAQFSAPLLKADGIHTIVLITHAAHMRRAMRMFREAGLDVIPAPTVFAPPLGSDEADFLPRMSGLEQSFYALYEILGEGWYALRH